MSSALSFASEAPSFTTGELLGARTRIQWPGGHLDSVHGAVIPADVRIGDPVSAHLRVPGGPPRPTPSQVWRISPLGVELVRPGELPGLGVGAPVELTLRVGRSTASFPSLRVTTTGQDRGRELVALSWARSVDRAGPTDDTRRAARWSCEGEYLPTGVAPSAARYADLVYFRVVDISWTGMQLETSLRNKFLIPGLRFEATCTFPTQGPVQLRLQVIHARVVKRGTKEILAVGVRYASRQSSRARTIIGQYLLQFGGGATVADLCAEGFSVPASSSALDFGSVRTAEDYAEVLRLRRLAYVHARKVSEDTKDLDMADDFDARSRILVAKHHGRVVGTVRLMYPRSERDPLKHEEFLALPTGLPSRLALVEVSKACTHPGYRGSDLFYALLKHTALTMLQSGRRYAVMSSTDGLARIYERCGFQRTGASYLHPSMRLRHHLMLAEMQNVVTGKGVNPVFWNLAGGWELWSFARECGVLPVDAWSLARARLWRLFRPAAELVRALLLRRAAGARPRADHAPARRIDSTTASPDGCSGNSGLARS